MNRARIAALERQFRVDDDPGVEMMADVAEFQRFDAWLAEQGYPDDPHAAIADGLKTPTAFGLTLEDCARADEDCKIYRWFMNWGFVVDFRRRLVDPRYDTDYFREHFRSQIEESMRDAEEARAKLAGWGIGYADLLSRARAMHTGTRPNGYRMPDEELERITAAIIDAERRRLESDSDSEQSADCLELVSVVV